VKRALSKDRIVVYDGLNYIKGYRYQLWCEAKASGTGCCVVHVAAPEGVCEGWNEGRRKRRKMEAEGKDGGEIVQRKMEADDTHEMAAQGDEAGTRQQSTTGTLSSTPADTRPTKEPSPAVTPTLPLTEISEEPYSPSTFSALTFRYEEPLHASRWDTPLFTVLHTDDVPPIREIFSTLTQSKRVVKPHAATVAPLPTSANALQILEQSTQDVVAKLAAWGRENGDSGGSAEVGEGEELEIPPGESVGLPRLQRLRRQFVGIQRASVGGQGVGGLQPMGIRGAFVRFLDSEFGGDG